MSYQVLARKYRPQRFEEVIGQRHVTQTLQNALELKRIHHAYLFTGARGIGKTTVARILAKALNCEKGVSKEPCNQCIGCQEILDGKSLDVQEIDGASNTGVDDVRQIREQTKYLPAKGRYKIYIIDEVHMLSQAAFNALLKTLEEPPEKTYFLLATTESHKIPATILSRCQRYDFKRIRTQELVLSLESIAKMEGIEASGEALHLIAHEAQGSLRDAQSLFDQAVAFAGKKLGFESLKEMLGFLDRAQFFKLLEAVLKKERQGALEQLNAFYQTGADLNRLAQDLFTNLRHLFLIRSLDAVPDWLDLPKEELEKLRSLSSFVSLEEIDQMVQLAYRGIEDIGRSAFPKMLLEVLLIRMTLVSQVVPLTEVLEKLERFSAVSPVSSPRPIPMPKKEPALTKTWDQFVDWLGKEKPQLASIVTHAHRTNLAGGEVAIVFDSDSIYGEMLKEEDRQRLFEQYLGNFFGRPLSVKVSFEVQEDVVKNAAPQTNEKDLKKAAMTHESVKEAMNILGAVVEEVRTK